MKRIIAATDFSDRSDRAIRRAALLASMFSAELILAHVVEDGQPEHLVRAMADLATIELGATAQSIAKVHGIECSARVVRGVASDGIVSLAKGAAADLVVLGTHRKNIWQDVFVGTTLERVLRTNASPALVVNADNSARYRNVLVAIDFSECSAQALRIATRLGLLAGSRVTILHVSNPSDAIERGETTGETDARIVAGNIKISQDLTQFLSAFHLKDIDYSARVRAEDGPPGPGIKKVAAAVDADLVVVGTRGKNRATRMLLGSVTDDLLKTLDKDVFVVSCAPAAVL